MVIPLRPRHRRRFSRRFTLQKKTAQLKLELQDDELYSGDRTATIADWTSLAVYFIEWGEMFDNVSDINTPEIGLSGLFKTRLGQILRVFSSKTHNAVHIKSDFDIKDSWQFE